MKVKVLGFHNLDNIYHKDSWIGQEVEFLFYNPSQWPGYSCGVIQKINNFGVLVGDPVFTIGLEYEYIMNCGELRERLESEFGWTTKDLARITKRSVSSVQNTLIKDKPVPRWLNLFVEYFHKADKYEIVNIIDN